MEGAPAIPASLVETAGRYGSFRNATLADWNPTRREMLIATRFADTAQQGFCGGAPHFLEGLANGGKSGILIGGALDVIEADDRNVMGNAQSGLAESANRSHCRDVVESEERGEPLSRCK